MKIVNFLIQCTCQLVFKSIKQYVHPSIDLIARADLLIKKLKITKIYAVAINFLIDDVTFNKS